MPRCWAVEAWTARFTARGTGVAGSVQKLNGCRTGEAKITQGYRLPAKFVIHTVGPVWFGGHRSEAVKLAEAYQNSLLLAQEHGIRSIAFPVSARACTVSR